uniref:UBX domain-containing protein n=1 Tax=Glossina brevipalpis TaxID=37001 RepID=A0A1A9WAS4_9MUSC
MEAKVTVLTPNGRRQNIKVTPNTTLLQILEEACQKHGFASDEYCLKHHNKEVSLSQMFRFSGLPNNCLLEMSQTDRKRIAATVDICIQLEDGNRHQAQFKPEDNLWQVVAQLGDGYIQTYENPVVIYTRQEIIGKQKMSETTLKSLGIIEGRALLRLLNKKPEELKTQANVYIAPAIKTTPKKSSGSEKTKKTNSNAGGGGFSISRNLMQNLKKSSDEKNVEVELEAGSNENQKEEPEKPKYDWSSGVGRSMQPSQIQIGSNNNESEMEEKNEPIYHIIGERCAIIYSLNEIHTQIEDLPDSFYDLTVNDLKLVLRDLKNIAAGNEDAPLLTEKLRELRDNRTMLNKISQYKNCVIRIKFPDRCVLQGMFKPIDKISDVIEFVRKFLRKPAKSFYLFTIPPKTKLILEKTLLELDFVPNALIHFSYEDESENVGNCIKSEFLTKLTSPEGAIYAASKFRRTQRKPSDTEANNNNVSNDDTQKPGPSTGAIPKRPRNDEVKKT